MTLRRGPDRGAPSLDAGLQVVILLLAIAVIVGVVVATDRNVIRLVAIVGGGLLTYAAGGRLLRALQRDGPLSSGRERPGGRE